MRRIRSDHQRGWSKLLVAALLMISAVAVSPGYAGAAPDEAAGPAAAGAPAQEVHTTTVRWGPFDVPANGMTENLIAKSNGCSFLVGFITDCVNMEIEKPCENCFITGITPNLVLAGTDTPVNYDTMGMLHHVVNLNFNQPDITCRPTIFGDVINLLGLVEGGNMRFFASGNERTPMTVPDGYGYYVGEEDDWGLIVDLMNMADVDRAFELEYTFEWVDAAEAVTPVWLDIDQCGDSEVDTDPGYTDIDYTWHSTLDGEIVSIGGHVHDQGIGQVVRNASTGEMICDSRAGYAAGGMGLPAAPGPGDPMHPANADIISSAPNPLLDLGSFNGHIAAMRVCEPGVAISSGPWWRRGDAIEMHTQYYHDDHDDHDDHGGHGDMGIMIAYVDED